MRRKRGRIGAGGGLDYETDLIEERFDGIEVRLHCIRDVEAAIDAMFAELEARGCPDLLEDLCPYFGSLWPAARVLARWMASQGRPAFEGKSVLELGCGLALPSFVAARLGARVWATDRHPDVSRFLERNLAANPGLAIRYESLDWRQGAAPETVDWVLASDVLYEKHQAASLVGFLRATLAPSGRAVILDPNRAYWERLVVLGRGAGLTVRHERLEPFDERDPGHAVLIEIRR